jgi:hypothetical protein
MKRLRRTSVAVGTLFLAAGLACDESNSPVAGGGPPGTDTVAPNAVRDLALSYQSGAHAVAFTWTAPRDDIGHDRVARYDIRYSYSFPLDWNRSIEIENPPPPLAAGEHQQVLLANPLRGRDVYAAIRTCDAAGNESVVSTVAHVRVPGVNVQVTCVDALSGAPIQGLDVQITSLQSWNLIAGADGRASVDDVATGTLGIRVRRGDAVAPYHGYADAFPLTADRALVIPMIQYLPTDSPLYDSHLDLLIQALVPGGANRVLRKWAAYPIPFYAPALVNVHGLDYRDLARRGAAQWNRRVGRPIFVEVPADPAVGVTMRFLTRDGMGGAIGFTERTNDAGGFPRLDTVKIIDEFSDEEKLYRVMVHELGHTIRLAHLADTFMMSPGTLPADITDDEVRLVQLMLALPNGVDLTHYDPAPPAPPARQ